MFGFVTKIRAAFDRLVAAINGTAETFEQLNQAMRDQLNLAEPQANHQVESRIAEVVEQGNGKPSRSRKKSD